MYNQCIALGCTRRVMPTKIMCARHWKIVPILIKRRILESYTRGQTDGMCPTQAWVDSIKEAILSVRWR